MSGPEEESKCGNCGQNGNRKRFTDNEDVRAEGAAEVIWPDVFMCTDEAMEGGSK